MKTKKLNCPALSVEYIYINYSWQNGWTEFIEIRKGSQGNIG